MGYWIFVAAPQVIGSETCTGRDIYAQRMKDGFWGLGERTAHRRNVRAGDQVVFYVARPESAFVGTARLATDSFELAPDERTRLSHGSAIYTAQFGVRLEAISTWESPHPVVVLAPSLEFIEDPSQWWAYLQGGVRQITQSDYTRIVTGVTAAADSGPACDAESASLFAVEAHLEEFIEHNWDKIAWGRFLRLFSDGEQTGRQYPAGTRSIDFLAVDQKTNDLVVIELKRGQTSDATVGQVLRYMTWVRENVATPGQAVHGIIVASEIDEALRYAARGLPNISVATYSVSFALQPVAV